MIKVSTQVDTAKIDKKISKQVQAIQRLPQEGLDEFRRLTPIDTGRARRETRLENKNTIHADYPYAERLDNNWSKQTKGQGIVKPFTKWLEKQLKQIARIK
ncbi:MAG: hypothetical protein RJA42_292 [Bacteroidota bacterium]|jgi:hypothetical protein